MDLRRCSSGGEDPASPPCWRERGDLGTLIDIELHRSAREVVDRILEERGLTFFLQGAGAPFALDERRVQLAVEIACRRLVHEPERAAREACVRSVRRKLIARVAEAMVKVGFWR